ncbi:MAG: hypothetical protein JRF34_11050 [Deltaproteobacteria bacterium]|nr:hypothetical protein [Deltaproteobacteria bacterium]
MKDEIPDFFFFFFFENGLGTPMIEDETLEWYRMSPTERFEESQKLWEIFTILGGSYDPEPDTQSPFHIFTT